MHWDYSIDRVIVYIFKGSWVVALYDKKLNGFVKQSNVETMKFPDTFSNEDEIKKYIIQKNLE